MLCSLFYPVLKYIFLILNNFASLLELQLDYGALVLFLTVKKLPRLTNQNTGSYMNTVRLCQKYASLQ